MRVTIQPPLAQWNISRSADAARRELATMVNRRAARLGTATLDVSKPIIATGHQAFLWHPGILTKYIAAAHAAERHGAALLNVIVDQDVYEALNLDIPVETDGRLSIQTLRLGACNPAIPTGSQPPVDPEDVLMQLQGAAGATRVDLSPIQKVWTNLPRCATLAEQVAVVLDRLMEPIAGRFAMLAASELMTLESSRGIVAQMLADPVKCVKSYNDAVAKFPGAGMTPMTVERDRVELPLWSLQWNGPRRRVYADLSDSRAELALPDGELPGAETLAPRALLLTALMRRFNYDFFIHGTGGGEYDRATEAWIANWLGQPLASMAVATADLHLNFDVPIATRADLARALWRTHHLPHNLDRELTLTGPDIARKNELLAHMNDDRDHRRRRVAFDELHRINDLLAKRHTNELSRVKREVERAKTGLANAAIASKRDWCFALYPPAQLAALAGAIGQRVIH